MSSPLEPVQLLVCGSREWPYPAWVFSRLAGYAQLYGPRLVVLHGDHYSGADWHAATACAALRIAQRRFPADWSLGQRAGPMRNQAMVDELVAGRDYVLAFRIALGRSAGTDHVCRLARRRGLHLDLVYSTHYDRGRLREWCEAHHQPAEVCRQLLSCPAMGQQPVTCQLRALGGLQASSEARP